MESISSCLDNLFVNEFDNSLAIMEPNIVGWDKGYFDPYHDCVVQEPIIVYGLACQFACDIDEMNIWF